MWVESPYACGKFLAFIYKWVLEWVEVLWGFWPRYDAQRNAMCKPCVDFRRKVEVEHDEWPAGSTSVPLCFEYCIWNPSSMRPRATSQISLKKWWSSSAPHQETSEVAWVDWEHLNHLHQFNHTNHTVFVYTCSLHLEWKMIISYYMFSHLPGWSQMNLCIPWSAFFTDIHM